MSRADGAARLVDAAIALGVSRGLGAMSVQGIANAAGVSKALVLYHHADKPALLRAIRARLVGESTARLRAATERIDAADPLESWRALARAEVASGHLALLAALGQEDAVRTLDDTVRRTLDRERLSSSGDLARAILRALGVAPRVDRDLLGALLLRQLDGLVVGHLGRDTGVGRVDGGRGGDLDAEIDTFALALLGLGA